MIKYHPLQLHNYYAHFPPLQNTHIHAKHNYAELVMGMIMGFEALYAGRGRRNPVWSGKEAPWSLRGLIVKSADHCGADYKPLDRLLPPLDSPRKCPPIWKEFLCHDVIMHSQQWTANSGCRLHGREMDLWGPFYWHVLTLIPAWISNNIPCRMWDEITYPFLNFNGCAVDV